MGLHRDLSKCLGLSPLFQIYKFIFFVVVDLIQTLESINTCEHFCFLSWWPPNNKPMAQQHSSFYVLFLFERWVGGGGCV